jgi:hypothetical protein
MTARRAPSDPQAIARQRAEERALAAQRIAKERDADPARWGEIDDAERIEALRAQGADVRLDFRGRVSSAQRGDIFHRLAARDAITPDQHRAVRRLEADMAIRAGRGGANDDMVFVDGASGGGCQGFAQRQVDAGIRVDRVLAMVGPPASRVLKEILEPAAALGADVDWKAAIARITGEKDDGVYTALLRFACQALADCYAAIDKERAECTRS